MSKEKALVCIKNYLENGKLIFVKDEDDPGDKGYWDLKYSLEGGTAMCEAAELFLYDNNDRLNWRSVKLAKEFGIAVHKRRGCFNEPIYICELMSDPRRSFLIE